MLLLLNFPLLFLFLSKSIQNFWWCTRAKNIGTSVSTSFKKGEVLKETVISVFFYVTFPRVCWCFPRKYGTRWRAERWKKFLGLERWLGHGGSKTLSIATILYTATKRKSQLRKQFQFLCSKKVPIQLHSNTSVNNTKCLHLASDAICPSKNAFFQVL